MCSDNSIGHLAFKIKTNYKISVVWIIMSRVYIILCIYYVWCKQFFLYDLGKYLEKRI